MIEASDAVYRVVGRINLGMERVHHQLARLISSLTGRKGRFSQIEQAVTAAVSLRQTTDLCEMLYLSLTESEEGAIEFKALLKRVRDLEQKRNGVVHAVWMPAGDEGEFIKWKFTRDKNHGIKFSDDRFDEVRFTKIADDCMSLERDLLIFVFRDHQRGGSPFHVGQIT